MHSSEATREILWNISHAWIMYALLVPAIFIAAYGVYQRIACWRRGKPVDRFDSTAKRFKMLFRHAILQTRLARETYSGILHRFISWGFIVLLAATAVVMVEYDFNIPLMRGHFYLYFQSLLVDAFGAFTLIGLVMAAIRRWGTKPARLVYTREGDLFLLILLLIVISGFFLEAWRIAATADPWAGWSPIGFLVARFSLLFGDGQSLGRAHRYLWWFHLLLAYGLIAFAPFMKKMLHVLTSPLNIYTANLDPIGANLKQIDLENTGVLGVNAINGFTWKDLLDLDACTECGRCTDNCPAHISGKSLSPRDIILELRVIMHQTMKKNGRGIAGKEPATVELSGKIPAESLWECTTCAACVEACPVFIEQMPKIVDMRRYLVMEKAAFPETIQNAIGSLEDRGHPIRGARATRLDWAKGLDVPLISETGDAEILFWVGSAGALLERSQRVTRALAQLLKLSGVRFAILGREEKSTGDLARRVGNEFLFKTLAEENIEILNQYHVKNIVTACPHSYNTLRNEYPRLGGKYNVYHYTEYLLQLVKDGKLKIPASVNKKVTFHDPCYLGRHNGIVDAPRDLLRMVSTGDLLEMERNRRQSFCCGGGGGMSFAEEPPDKRLNKHRARQALETGADVVAVACPYCMTMLEDGVKAERGDRDTTVMDIAELLYDAVK